MCRQRLVLAVAGLIGLCLAAAVAAQESYSPEDQNLRPQHRHQSKSLVERLDDVGRTIFGGVLPSQQPSARPPAPSTPRPSATPRTASRTSLLNPASPSVRAAPAAGANEDAIRPSAPAKDPVLPSLDELEEEKPSAVPTRPTPATVMTPGAPGATGHGLPGMSAPPATPAPRVAAPASSAGISPSPGVASPAAAAGTSSLHERLKGLRDSAFGHSPPVAAAPAAGRAAPDRVPAGMEAADPPAAAAAATPARGRVLVPTQAHPAPDAGSPDLSRGGLQNPMTMQPKSPEGAAVQREVAEHFASQRAAREAALDAARKTALEKAAAEKAAAQPARTEPAPAASTRAGPSGAAAAQPGPAAPSDAGVPAGRDSVLFTRQSPILNVETQGPRRISVGKESAYEVVIHNSGQVAANDLVVTVELPAWADVLGAEASAGATQSVDAAGRTGQFQWKVGRLEAKSQQKLVLRIVPRESKPFELGVRWSFTPVRSQAEIEVQEPKLEVNLEGPREVTHGQKEVYKLVMANTGNGPAENLLVSLASTGGGENVTASHKLGTLAAGEKKVIEVELTARQAGQLTIEVNVKGDGAAQASLSEKITVRKPELGLKIDGPKSQYVGTPATYQVRVSNTGTAPARNVRVVATLADGVEQAAPSQDVRAPFDRRKAQWSFAEIAAGASHDLAIQCVLASAGTGRVAIEASGDDNLAASDSITTQIEALADLGLSVIDPASPVPVGQEAVYEIRIVNRGTKSAQNVETVAYFSQGIEPFAAEGAGNKIGPGQVLFSPIPSIAAGQTLVLKIKAKAEAAGNHVFRTEVYCRAAGTRLVSEETTRYYGESVAAATMLAKPDASRTTADAPAVRTAERLPARSSSEPAGATRKN